MWTSEICFNFKKMGKLLENLMKFHYEIAS